MHDVCIIILIPFQPIMIITHLDLGGGLGSKLLYYVVHFTAITGSYFQYLISCPYDILKFTYSTL